MNQKNIYSNYAIFIFIFGLFAIDIGNPDALRQGTEGFYLQVSKEMFLSGNFFTPLYLGNNHWSKPFLHFILPYPGYFFESSPGLLSARLSIFIITFLLFYPIAKWIENTFSINRSLSYLFFFSTIGFFKYSRIYMMEMPLTLLTFLGSIYLFNYLEESKGKNLIFAVFFSSLSCLIKGPVSLLMIGLAATSYSVYHYLIFKKFFFRQILIWTILTSIVSGVWFLGQYFTHGSEFFEYFFLRENIGKFTAKSYPIRSVFSGLFLYGLPWSLGITTLIIFLRSKGASLLADQKNKVIVYLIICFVVFFGIWLIPNQRSHHYALPALLPFLLLIFISTFYNKSGKKFFRFRFFIVLISFIFLILNVLTFFFNEFIDSNYKLITLSISLALLTSIIVLGLKTTKPKNLFIGQLILIATIWNLFLPRFYLPLVPSFIIETTKNYNNIGTVHRKPYFISEAIQRPVSVLRIDQIEGHFSNTGGPIFISENLYKLAENKNTHKILATWAVWRRGINAQEIIKSLRLNNLKNIKENMLLIGP